MKPRARDVAAIVMSLVAFAAAPAGASASGRSIALTIESYVGQLEAAETQFATAVTRYRTDRVASAVESSAAQVVSTLRSLRRAIAAQPAKTVRIQRGKRRVEEGLQALIAYYDSISKVYAEDAAHPAAAERAAVRALAAIKRSAHELRQGLRLLRY